MTTPGSRTRSSGQHQLVRFALGHLDPSAPGVATAGQLLHFSRRTTTVNSYDGKLSKFLDFCGPVQEAAGCPSLCPCPAKPSTILAYLGWLADEGTVHAGSLQPYLSAINSFHADQGLDRPAVGHLVQLARKGFGELEGTLDPDQATRRPLPASAVWSFLRLGMSCSDMHVLRITTCLVLQFCFFARSDTGAQALDQDIILDSAGLSWRERTKTLSRIEPATLTIPRTAPSASAVLALFDRYRAALGPRPAVTPLWMLPTDRHPPRSTSVDAWLQEALDLIQLSPPPGVKWSSHSLRSGGATAALSVGVDLASIARWGLWKDFGSLQVYVDPLVAASPEAVTFFGHLLKARSFDHLPPPADVPVANC